MSAYFRELVDRIDTRFSIDSKDMSIGDWICANTKLRSRPFSFDRYPFQKAIADDMHPNMDVVKPSQVGLSEVQIRKSLAFLARNRGTSLIFTMPTDQMFERMASTRILPIVKEEKVFNLDTASGEKPTRSKGLMQIGTSFLYATGMKEGDATSISADVVFNDEIDLSDQQMLALFNSRLQNSDWKINQRFSTPTFHSFGVDAGYAKSDQREYMCKCDACNHWNIPIFSESFVDLPGLPTDMALLELDESLIDAGVVNLNDGQVVCEKCRAPLDLGRTENREWVARFGSRTHHRGYRVSPFSTDRLSVQYILSQMFRYRQRDYMRGFHNTVLGRAYNAGSARLSEAEILACFTPQREVPTPDRSKPTWVGIDVGKVCHLMVSQGNSLEDQNVILFKTLPVEKLLEEVEIVLSTYNVMGGSCDRHPYTPTADALRDLSKGKILPIEYRGQKDVNLVKDQLTEEVTHGQVNRTTMIDLIVKAIRLGRISFSGYSNHRQVILEHFQDMVRDETPEKPATWVKMTGNDHFFHAGAFLVSAIRMKELEHGLYGENRSTVMMAGVDMNATQDLPYNISKRRNSSIKTLGYY